MLTPFRMGEKHFQMGEKVGISMAITELPHDHGEETAILRQLPFAGDFHTAAEIFKQLGDTTRIRIFWLLCHCEECVVNISAMLDMSSPAVSHHLRPLRSSGLIVSRREGKEVYYRAADTPLSHLSHQMIEQVMEIACPKQAALHAPHGSQPEKADGQPAYREQVEIIREIHKQLIEHLDQRFTIESLAKQYLMNPTTLKTMFKSVYGTSIAAHIKAHRMEQAARLLRETDLRVAEIAARVGYDSQSKFSTAFKAAYQTLPREYRRKYQP